MLLSEFHTKIALFITVLTYVLLGNSITTQKVKLIYILIT